MQHLKKLETYAMENQYQLRTVADQTGSEVELWTLPEPVSQHQTIVGRVKASSLEKASRQLMENK